MEMSRIEKLVQAQAPAWRARGYALATGPDGVSVVAGDCAQFYCDAVANDAQAAVLMEYLRRKSPQEYDRYRAEAETDRIDLDESQDVFVNTRAPGWVGNWR